MISRLLVANRGEIASRIFRACRELGIETVAVYAEPDATLPFVRQADMAVALGGTSASDSYLVVDKILDAARQSNADAVHPGFGFLSENAGFAQAVIDAGLIWIGPTPSNIAAMGTKVEAKQLAADAGVPVLPSAVASGDDEADWLASAEGVGYPVLVKASSGGGGRGMRIVASPSDLVDAIMSARREAHSSFGDATVFMERYLPAARHIEIQVFGDQLGNVVHLGERECSIQRRHQKIVEEAPSPVLSDTMRAAMGNSAVALAKAIGYIGAGTVEYLYDDSRSDVPEYFFLEMNTRLQVEHPVTECVTGTDLVRWQIAVANGEPLPLMQEQVERRGHAIEVRLYAEDPAQDFLPSFGCMHTYQRGSQSASSGLRFEDGLESGSVITTAFDPMVAKVIAHAPTRSDAARQLATALAGLHLHGPVTNRDYLVGVLRSDDYLAGNTTTAFVDAHPELRAPALPHNTVRLHVIAAALSDSLRRRCADRLWRFAPSGFRNLPSQPQRVSYEGSRFVGVEYRFDEFDATRCTVSTTIDGESVTSRVRVISHVGPSLTLDLDGITRVVQVTPIEDTLWVNTTDGQTWWTLISPFPTVNLAAAAGGPVAPVPGKVVAVTVAPGQSVKAGDVLVIMEAMKMEHRIEAAADGVIGEVLCSAGDQVDAHQVLVTLTAA